MIIQQLYDYGQDLILSMAYASIIILSLQYFSSQI